ncbi:MAG: phospho-sugar mutase [Ekhidna sp.]
MISKQKAENWLNAKNIDTDSKQEIAKLLEGEDLPLDEAFLNDLEFGTGGLRGIMGIGTSRINKYTIGMATQGFANYLKKEIQGDIKVAIAHDSRNNSRFFAETTANVFSANGIEVFLFEDLRPTPQLSFAIRQLGCQGGVVLTASHNPKEYNGYKAYWSDGAQILSPHDVNIIQEVSSISSIDKIKFEANPKLIHSLGEEMDVKYISMIKDLCLSPDAIKNQKDLKIVFSSIHGTGITLIPRTLKEIGFENVNVVASQAEPNGDFPTVVYPNPEEAEAMSHAMQEASKLDADLVMATDPDADRVGIAVKNTKGEFQLLNGNQTGALIVYYLLSKHKEKGFDGNEYIGKTIVTTELIREISKGFNIPCYDTLTGFKYIAGLIAKLEGKEKFIGGGEESYGYMIGEEVRDKDAVSSAVIISEMTAWAKDQGKSLFELLIEVNQKFGLYQESLKSITKKGLQGASEIKEMMEGFRNSPPKTLADSQVTSVIDYLEGKEKFSNGKVEEINLPESNVLQYNTADGTKVSIRPSGTEPKIKFYFSVKGSLESNEYFNEISRLENKTHKLLNDLNL